jgi:DMSO/TMAO reductase YedYZ molybdopterin-dependent catalytic subunit
VTSTPPAPSAAAAGALAGAVALGITELGAGISGGRSLVVGVGDWVIDHAPREVVRFGIRTFGTNDKPVLVATIVVVSLFLGAVLGLASRRRRAVGRLAIVAFGVMGVVASVGEPQQSLPSAAFAATLGTTTGIAALEVLLRSAMPAHRPPRAATRSTVTGRRAFVRLAAGTVVVAGASALAGRALLESGGRAVAAARLKLGLPTVRTRATPPSPATDVGVRGVTPLVTANDAFYRIDTALTFPQIDHTEWRLRVHGMLSAPFTVSYARLAAMDLVERYVTLTCVSNEVGGNLVSTAAWVGVPLRDLLARAGIDAAADQVVGRSVDGFTVGFPIEAALDDRDAMVAIGMNGEPLPIAHGFPARLIVPGLYGYVSATKWLSEIELARFDSFDAYWVQRGWARQGAIKTQSRIDVPVARRKLRPTTVPVAGVAWAPTRGIARVEVQVDDGEWREARLAEALSADTWRQWVYLWDATPGQHRLRVRATDGDGVLQDGRDRPPEPSGATGYHTISVTVAN